MVCVCLIYFILDELKLGKLGVYIKLKEGDFVMLVLERNYFCGFV